MFLFNKSEDGKLKTGIGMNNIWYYIFNSLNYYYKLIKIFQAMGSYLRFS